MKECQYLTVSITTLDLLSSLLSTVSLNFSFRAGGKILSDNRPRLKEDITKI